MQEDSRDCIFSALADNNDFISNSSLVKFYSDENVDSSSGNIDSSMRITDAQKAIEVFNELIIGRDDDRHDISTHQIGTTTINQLQFQRGLDTIMRIVDESDDGMLIRSEIDRYCLRCIKELPNDVIALLGLPSDFSRSELKALLSEDL